MIKDYAAEIRVGPFLKQWLLHSTGKEPLVLNKQSNLWHIISQNLELLPEDYKAQFDKDEFIQVQLLDGHNTRRWNNKDQKSIHLNQLYRCYVSEEGSQQIRRYLMAQFREVFRAYMVGYCSNPDNKILDGITEFLSDFGVEVNKTILERLMKDWYRYRKKHDRKIYFSIFF